MRIVFGSFIMGALVGAFGLLGMIHWTPPAPAAKPPALAAAPGMVYVLASRRP